MSYDYEYRHCPRCNARLKIGYSVSVEIETIARVGVEGKSLYNLDRSDEWAEYRFDRSQLPSTEGIGNFFQPVEYNGSQWWATGHELFRGQPVANMLIDQSLPALPGIDILISRYSDKTHRCTPELADEFLILMRHTDGTSGITKRNVVDICHHVWPDGEWYQCDAGYAYWCDNKLCCVSMLFTEART